MKILQFGFYGADSEYLPHRYPRDCVVYTGTHDNDTARGWYASAQARGAAARLRLPGLGRPRDRVGPDPRGAWTSVAARAIVPLQDVLGLGSEARMNIPAEPAGNWHWRREPDAFRPELAERLRRLTELSGRLPTARLHALPTTSPPPPETPTAAR